MNKDEAQELLSQEIKIFKTKSYQALFGLLKSPLQFDRKGRTGTTYQIEVQVFLDNPREVDGNLRVLISIDDGRFPAVFVPLTDDFIISPDEEFVDE